MLLETTGLYNYLDNKEGYTNSSLEISNLTDNQKALLLFSLMIYFFVTIYVAVKFPIGGSVALSVILALFFSTVFWFVNVIRLLYYMTNNLNKNVKKKVNKVKNNRKTRKANKTKSKYKPIY